MLNVNLFVLCRAFMASAIFHLLGGNNDVFVHGRVSRTRCSEDEAVRLIIIGNLLWRRQAISRTSTVATSLTPDTQLQEHLPKHRPASPKLKDRSIRILDP